MADEGKAQEIQAAEKELDDEHRILIELVDRLKEVGEVGDLATILDELHPALHEHFQKEEHPGGLYHRIGACSERYRDLVRELVDDHYRILSKVRALSARSKDAAPADADGLITESRKLVGWLKAHGARERDMAEVAREAALA